MEDIKIRVCEISLKKSQKYQRAVTVVIGISNIGKQGVAFFWFPKRKLHHKEPQKSCSMQSNHRLQGLSPNHYRSMKLTHSTGLRQGTE